MAPKGVKKEPKDKTAADDLRKQQANMVTQLAKSTDPNKQGVLATYKALQGSVTKKRNFCHCGQRTSLANGIPPGKKQFFLMRRRQ